MPSLQMLLRQWYFLVLPLAGAALALTFVTLQGDSYRASAELTVDARSGGLASLILPNRPNTSLAKTSDGIRIVGLGATAEAAANNVQTMADMLITGVTTPGDELKATDGPSEKTRRAAQDRLQLEEIAKDVATLQSYADLLKVPGNGATTAAGFATDLPANASALVDVLRMLDEKQGRANWIESRLRDAIPPQPVTIATTTLPLTPGPAVLSGLLGGLFAAFIVSALLAVRRKTPAWT